MRLNTYFRRKEFACRCGCGKDTVDVELLTVLVMLRNHFNAPIYINSGHRCETHNVTVGGAKNSLHLEGKAADVSVDGVRPEHVADWLEKMFPNHYGIGRYNGWTHIDVRPGKARWDKRS